MHISDGVLNASLTGTAILVGGGLVAVAGACIGLGKTDYERIPTVAVLSSAFFVASLIHLRVGPSSVHLLLVGLVGLILGWAAFPALLGALFLQAVFFGHGGLTTLGVNACNFGVAALAIYFLFNGPIRRARSARAASVLAFAAGAAGIVIAALLFCAELLAIGEEFAVLAETLFIAHLPVAVIEGFVTMSAVMFLRRVKPELLAAPCS